MNQNKNTILAELAFRSLVVPMLKYPENLEVSAYTEGEAVIVEACAHYADTGKLIGKNQVNYDAIKHLLQIVGEKNGFQIKFGRPLPAKIGSPEPQANIRDNPKWKPDGILHIMREFLETFLANPFKLETEAEGDWTKIIVNVSRSEKLPVAVGQMAFSLSKIFHAIGRAQGRKVKVNADATAP